MASEPNICESCGYPGQWLQEELVRVHNLLLSWIPGGGEGFLECQHPADGVLWNPYNKVTQCHRCGVQLNDGQADG